MANAGYDQAAIEEAIDRLADEEHQDRKDRALEARLKRMDFDVERVRDCPAANDDEERMRA